MTIQKRCKAFSRNSRFCAIVHIDSAKVLRKDAEMDGGTD